MDMPSTPAASSSSSLSPQHPEAVLFAGEARGLMLPVCDHYAGNEKFIDKALALQAERGPVFDITADCEDGAPVGRETEHAQMVARALASSNNQYGRVGVRIHDRLHPHWKRDVELVVSAEPERLAYVVLPKIRSAADVEAMATHINVVAGSRRKKALPLHVLIETHGALREIDAIASHPQVECLSFGLMDFVSAHHGAIGPDALRSPGQFDHPLVRRAKLEISAAAHAHGKVASHNVSTSLRDKAAIRSDALRAVKEFGYTRMWSVHPDQIDAIIAGMTPDHAALEQASSILLAAADANWGPIDHEGTLHDRASFRLFWSLLKRARAAGAQLPPAAEKAFFAEAGR